MGVFASRAAPQPKRGPVRLSAGSLGEVDLPEVENGQRLGAALWGGRRRLEIPALHKVGQVHSHHVCEETRVKV